MVKVTDSNPVIQNTLETVTTGCLNFFLLVMPKKVIHIVL